MGWTPSQPKEVRVCRFCLCSECEEDCGKDFVQPCPCRGSSAFVHLSCLVHHFQVRGEWHNFKCPTCHQSYEGQALYELAEMSRVRMIKEFGEDSMKVAQSLDALAQAHKQLGKALETKNVLEQSLAIKEKRFGAGHISTAATLNNLATANRELGNVQKEKDLVERSLAIKEKHFGKGHVQTAASLVNLAGVCSELGDNSKACELLRQSLAISQQHYGVGHMETVVTLNNLAMACGEMGKVAEMRQYLEQSLSIREKHFGKGHLESCLTLANLGMACGVTGKQCLAKDYSSRALLSCGTADGPKSRRLGVVLLRVAAVYCALADVATAEALVSKAAAVLEEALGAAAGTKVLGSERTRTSRIWSAAGRDDVVGWLDTTWVS